MQRYSWKGIDELGVYRKGVLLANSEQDLKNKLLAQKIALLKFRNASNFLVSRFLYFSRKVPFVQVIYFFNHISLLVESGIDLLKAISLVANQIKSKVFQKIVLQIQSDVDKGSSFSDALQKHKKVFTPFMVWMVKAGEKTGKLDFVLKQLSDFLSLRFNLAKHLKQAAVLPMITLVFAFLLVLGIFIFIVPQFESLFESMDHQLPATTKFVLSISNFLRSDGIWLFSGFLLLLIIFFRFLFALPAIKNSKDELFCKIYFLRNIVINFDLICFLQILSLCLKSGIPLKDALVNSEQIAKNFVFKRKITDLTNLVSQGKSFTQALQVVGNDFFPESLIAAVSVGEQVGNLDLMLAKQAAFFRTELDSKLAVITSLLQPILMIIIGLIIAFLMLAIYLPIFNMSSLFS